MILYIDTLAVLFRSYYAIGDLRADDNTPTGALYGLINTLFKVIEELDPEYVVACFDSKEQTQRQQENEDYKANREEPDEDMIIQIELAKKLLKSLGVAVVEKSGYEADDIIGTLANESAKNNENSVILTCDGDILQLTKNKNIKVYFLQKGISKMSLFDEKKTQERNGYPVEYIIDYKGLAGDASDNIKGVRGIGDVTAKKLINTFGDIDNIYKELKQKKSLKGLTERVVNLLIEGEKDARLSKDLGTIHTDVPKISFSKKKWSDCFDLEKAKKELEKYNFSTLILKLDKNKTESTSSPKVDEDKVEIAKLLLWITDAELVEKSYEEILSYTKKGTLEEAIVFLENKIDEQEKNVLWEKIEKPLIPIVKKMEKKGIKLDKDKLFSLSKIYESKLTSLEKDIYKLADKEFNINSPKQLGEVLFKDLSLSPQKNKKTSTGKKSTNEEVLKSMIDMHPIIKNILDYRHYKKLKSTYVDAYAKYLDKNDRVHSTFLQGGTGTGRFSSKDPNLQNIPAPFGDGKDIRDIFIAEKGHLFYSLDYSQMELRVAAILSKDKILEDIFKKDLDVHTAVASTIFKKDLKKINKKERDVAKTINFGILYGMGATALSKSLNIERKEADKFLDDYKKNFKDLFKYLESVKSFARENEFVKTLFNRTRSVNNINSSLSFVSSMAERVAINTPIQGTSADIIKLAIVLIDKYIKENNLEEDVAIILQIHDEVLLEVKNGVSQKVIKDIKDIMENVIKNESEIKMKVDLEKGERLGSLC